MSLKRIAVIGAGGFAREVVWLLNDLNRVSPAYEFVGYVVSDLSRVVEHDSREQIAGDYEWLAANQGTMVDAVAIGIGTPAARLTVAADVQERFPYLEWPSLIHPSVKLGRDSAQIGKGVILCAGVIATVNIVFEDFALCNLACTIGHEARIGTGSVLNPSVNISGGVNVGAGVLVGTGAQILQYLRVGDGATVGAGAVVNKDVPVGVTVVGVPAKVLCRAVQS